MPSSSRLFVAPFMRGLNTELTQTEDATLYTIDELNCTILPENMRGRRYGFNIERDGEWITVPSDGSSSSFKGYLWKNVGNTEISYIVYQIGIYIYFFDAASKPFSKNKITASINLKDYITDENAFYQYPVKFITGSGDLIIVSKYLEPLKVSYDFNENTFNIEIINIMIRDMEGIDDGMEVDELDSELTKEHHYNLLNQGWSEQDIEQFHTDRNSYPANNLQWFIGKDDSGEYNTETLLRHYFGNTPAPKGHYYFNYFAQDRSLASGIFAENARTATYDYQRTWVSSRHLLGVAIKSFSIDIPASSGTATHLGLNFSKLYRKTGKKSGDNMWSGNVDVTLYGYKGENLYEVASDSYVVYGSPDIHTFAFTENITKYDKYKVHVAFSDGNGVPDKWSDAYTNPLGVTCTFSLSIKEDGSAFPYNVTPNRVTDVEYMCGKYFYLIGNSVLFSQTITDTLKNCGKCYQDADPTSEDISDILPTDGGIVKFQTMGDGISLKAFNRGIIVFGSNNVYGLISPVNNKFSATEYDIIELSKAGLIGQHSVVSVDTSVYYWSPLGIFQIGINSYSGSTLISQNISQGTIQTFYNNLPSYSKENCRGAFDYVNNRIYWFYPTNSENIYKLDGCLVYDLNYSSFYPFKIAEEGGSILDVFETTISNMIEPTMYVRAGGTRVVAGGQPVIAAEEQDTKFNRWTAVQYCIINEDNEISFGDFNSREFYDWDNQQYDSYLVSRPVVVEDTYFNKQVPILQTLFKRTEEYPLNAKTTTIVSDSNRIKEAPDVYPNSYTFSSSIWDTDTIRKPISFNVKIIGVARKQIISLDTKIKNAEFILYRQDRSNGFNYIQNVSYPRDFKVGDSFTIPCDVGQYGDRFFLYLSIPKKNNGVIDYVNLDFTVMYDSSEQLIKDTNYIAASGAYIRMRWGWSLNDKSNRWDLIQNAYRPQKDFMNDEFVESRMHIKGRGKAFQIEVRNDDNKDFRLAGMNMIVRKPQ